MPEAILASSPTVGQVVTDPRQARQGPAFDSEVTARGYLWWYLDALSEDGRHGLTCIIFVGSVFSPYYAASSGDRPANHANINLALYGPDRRRWVMTERPETSIERTPDRYRLARSSVRWQDGRLIYEVDEWANPLPRPVRGQMIVTPRVRPERMFRLDGEGRHVWQPVAPVCDVTVEFDQPRLAWRGTGYLDSNQGIEPLAAGFRNWHWSRMHRQALGRAGHETLICYDAVERRGHRKVLFLRIGPDGVIRPLPPARALPLAGTVWRIDRLGHSDSGLPGSARVVRTFEDTPFYARSQIEATLGGVTATGFHESLDLDRFSAPWVQFLLPFRMPRRHG